METDERAQKLAEEALSYFTGGTRDNGERYWNAKGSPQWVTDMIRAAHMTGPMPPMLPDDYRYEFIVEMLGHITDISDLDEPEIEADINTWELTKWLASSNSRHCYCDEYAEEFDVGAHDNGAWNLLAGGQYMEKVEVYWQLVTYLRDMAEDLEEE